MAMSYTKIDTNTWMYIHFYVLFQRTYNLHSTILSHKLVIVSLIVYIIVIVSFHSGVIRAYTKQNGSMVNKEHTFEISRIKPVDI